jgi:pilus assembly protein Flp/PilA
MGPLSKIGTGWTGVNQSEALMKNLVSRFITDESGVTAIEYGLIAALVAVVIIGAVTTLGTSLTKTFGSVSASL